MDVGKALEFFEENRLGVLATIATDGRPHVSIVFGAVIDGGIWISTTQTRVKTKNIRRDPRVVFTAGTRPWTAIEGTARIHDGVDVLQRLRRYYSTAVGEHPDWDEYDAAMIAEQRVIIELEPARAYGFG